MKINHLFWMIYFDTRRAANRCSWQLTKHWPYCIKREREIRCTPWTAITWRTIIDKQKRPSIKQTGNKYHIKIPQQPLLLILHQTGYIQSIYHRFTRVFVDKHDFVIKCNWHIYCSIDVRLKPSTALIHQN